MVNMLKEQKAGILSGVIASAVFIYFIQPILNFSAFVFIRGSEIIGNTYTDRIYQQVAHLETHDYSFLFLMLFLGFPAATLLGASIRITINLFKKRKAESSDEEDQEGEKDEEVDKTKPPKIIRALVALLLFSISSFLFSIVVANFIQLSTISSFKQHIRIIAPYIGDQEEENLVSEWSLINSKNCLLYTSDAADE